MNDLSTRREATLFKELHQTGDPALREQLVRRYLPLARHVAWRFHRNGGSFDDLFQVASYGLVKAIDKFDPDRGLAFSSYAVPTMSGELKRHARDTAWGMRQATASRPLPAGSRSRVRHSTRRSRRGGPALRAGRGHPIDRTVAARPAPP